MIGARLWDNPAVSGVRFRLLISSLILLQSLLIYVFVAQRFPLSGDDYSYLYQARLFADGRLYAEDPLYDHRHPLNHCLAVNCLRDEQGRRFSKYAPGWPALLSLGVRGHAPWLVQPLLAALLAFLILGYVEQRMGRDLVKTAAWLLMLCLFFAYYGASYRPHLATALCVFSAFLAYERSRQPSPHRRLWLTLAGGVLGASALMRYTDWVPLALWIVFIEARERRYRDGLVCIASLVLVAGGNLAWGWILSGQPFVAPTHLGGDIGDHDRLTVSLEGVAITAGRLALVLWVFPPVVLLARYWARLSSAGADITLLALFLANAAVYYFFAAAVGGPGPRYFFSYFPFLVVAVLDVYRRFIRDGGVVDRRWWHAVLVAQVVGSAIFVAREAYTLYGRRDLERTLAARWDAGASRDIIVLTTGTYHTDAMDLTRNPPSLASAHHLYLSHCASPDIDALRERFPERDVYAYAYPGRLTRTNRAGE